MGREGWLLQMEEQNWGFLEGKTKIRNSEVHWSDRGALPIVKHKASWNLLLHLKTTVAGMWSRCNVFISFKRKYLTTVNDSNYLATTG